MVRSVRPCIVRGLVSRVLRRQLAGRHDMYGPFGEMWAVNGTDSEVAYSTTTRMHDCGTGMENDSRMLKLGYTAREDDGSAREMKVPMSILTEKVDSPAGKGDDGRASV